MGHPAAWSPAESAKPCGQDFFSAGKRWMTIRNIGSLDPGSYENWRMMSRKKQIQATCISLNVNKTRFNSIITCPKKVNCQTNAYSDSSLIIVIYSTFLLYTPISSGFSSPSSRQDTQTRPVGNPEAQLHHEGFLGLKLHTSGVPIKRTGQKHGISGRNFG